MTDSLAIQTREISLRKFMTAVYSWMVLALVVSAVSAYVTATNPVILRAVFGTPGVFLALIIGELVLVFVLSARIHKMSVAGASVMFLVYSVLNGVTLSVVLLAYTGASVFRVFAITAGMFICMSVYGRVTKSDLRSAGRYLMMGLFRIIIASLVNIFFRSSGLDWIISLATVTVFAGLTAYDTQKLTVIAERIGDNETASKVAVIGALELYLDFINIFLALLRLFGKSRN